MWAALASFGAVTNAVLMQLSLLTILRVDVPWLDVFWAWPLAMLVGVLPVTVAGMGTRDLAFLWTLRTAGEGASDSSGVLLVSLVYAVFATWLPTVFGLPFTLLEGRRRHRSAPAASPSATADC